MPIEVDTRAHTYRVSSGARWRDVIAALDRRGFSPKVMQSNNDFSVGGTFSVNAHGWPVPFGPMGSTVRSFRIMLADGSVVSVARGHELFGLAMGGYGLMGMILDLELEMTPNLWLGPRFEVMPSSDFARRFLASQRGPDAAKLAYGRLSVAGEGFLDEAALVSFRGQDPAPGGDAGSGGGSVMSTLTRSVYRAQLGSEAMKRARWYAETQLQPKLQPKRVTRNALLNTPVRLLEERGTERTDILHEYFIPPAQLSAFLEACRAVIPRSGQELLNVTLRYVAPDTQSVLAFAPQERIAAVMSFSQRRTAEGERGMRAMTEALVERVLMIGGGYYLPYRLHARPDQFQRAYPQWAAFAQAKRRYDPKSVFRHTLWDRYFVA
jgi:FAD/FMN-containing dehydrogenase